MDRAAVLQPRPQIRSEPLGGLGEEVAVALPGLTEEHEPCGEVCMRPAGEVDVDDLDLGCVQECVNGAVDDWVGALESHPAHDG